MSIGRQLLCGTHVVVRLSVICVQQDRISSGERSEVRKRTSVFDNLAVPANSPGPEALLPRLSIFLMGLLFFVACKFLPALHPSQHSCYITSGVVVGMCAGSQHGLCRRDAPICERSPKRQQFLCQVVACVCQTTACTRTNTADTEPGSASWVARGLILVTDRENGSLV
jgi:hypothetical protein